MKKLKSFSCEICPYKGKTVIHLKRHKETHQNRLCCDYCEFVTAHYTSLLRHKRTFHNKVQKSKDVVKRGKLRRGKENSKLNVKTKIVHSCQYCMFITKHKVSLKRHVLLKHKRRSIEYYKCEYCDYKHIEYYTIRKHTLNVHKQKTAPQVCIKCGEKFSTYMEKKCHNWKYLNKGISCKNKDSVNDENDDSSQTSGSSSENDENSEENVISESKISSNESKPLVNCKDSFQSCFDLKNVFFECKLCDKQYLRQSFLDNHISVAHNFNNTLRNLKSVPLKNVVVGNALTNRCKLCQVVCNSEEALTNHLKRHRFVYDDS